MSGELDIHDDALAEAGALMLRFAERTRIGERAATRRYLWTDAFAVCNYLALNQRTGDVRFDALAAALVDDVHHVLGQRRADEHSSGWLDAADEDHPTRGGLRIGKPLPERSGDEPFDERLEWERDGQYFHYLTKWMHALDQLARHSGHARSNVWARELAATAVRAFVYRARDGAPRMAWKMSVDLSRPQIASMGQHDPLDGWLTCVQLRSTARTLDADGEGPDLVGESGLLASMVDRANLPTGDPLGIGGLLMDAARAAQLAASDALDDAALLDDLLGAAALSLEHYAARREHAAPPAQRLAFRELGLAIGMAAVPLVHTALARTPARFRAAGRPQPRLARLTHHEPLARAIVATWRVAANCDNPSWAEHRDINEVMLATSLVPEGVLRLGVDG